MELFREGFDSANRFDLKDEVIYKNKKYMISTVDLGIDHSFGLGEPTYYETMIFEDGSWSDLYCERYATQELAEKGHKEAITKLKEGKVI